MKATFSGPIFSLATGRNTMTVIPLSLLGRPHVSGSQDGALRLLWERRTRAVELVFPLTAMGDPFLVWRSSSHEVTMVEPYGTLINPSLGQVRAWLMWLGGGTRPE